jgi:type IV secretion system protein VirB1
MSLTVQAALALALQCAPAVDPHMIVAIGQRESGLDPLTIHDNTTGTVQHGDGAVLAASQLIAAGHSVDVGLMQINSQNLSLLGLGLHDAFEACQSIEAAAKLLALFSKYNTGSPTSGIANGYAMRVMAAMDEVRTGRLRAAAEDPGRTVVTSTEQQPACERPVDVWAHDQCARADQDDFVHHYDGEKPHE